VKTKSTTRAELNRLAIVDRALAVADAEGIEAVTTRRLAQEFGVTPMALYWHFKNKDELLAAMGDRFFDDMAVVAGDGDWPEQLRAIISGLVDALRRHPGAAHLAGTRVLSCDSGRDVAERALRVLRGAGFDVTQAANLAGAAMQIATTLVLGEAGAEPSVAESERDAVREAKRATLAGLPPSRYPNLIESADAFCQCDDADAYFAFGVDLFVAGATQLQRHLAAESAS
jgi:AcrR family transcriptional regulator